MMIKELFGQAVSCSVTGDALFALGQIHRPEINLVGAFLPPAPETIAFLQSLDVENRFIRAGVGRDAGYGRDVAFYHWRNDEFFTVPETVLPEIEGFEFFKADIISRMRLFQAVTGFDDVRAMIRVLPAQKDNLVVHIDNQTTLRGLQTLLGNVNTFWLPDRHVKIENHYFEYDDEGNLCGNCLKTTFDDLRPPLKTLYFSMRA